MKSGRRRAAAAAVLVLVLASIGACATGRPVDRPDWLVGRISVRVDAVAGRALRSFSSGFELRGDAEQGELRLNSPLGSRVATAIWAPGVARLITSEGESRYLDLDTLASQALGEALPLRALPAWLHGLPWPGADSRPSTDGFDQLGWQIVLTRVADGWIEAKRSAPPAVSVRARLEQPG